MRQVMDLLPAHLGDDLVGLARYAAANGGVKGVLSPCAELTALPEAAIDRLDAWCGLASLLLTQGDAWRSRFTAAEGFPPGNSTEEGKRARVLKENVVALVAT